MLQPLLLQSLALFSAPCFLFQVYQGELPSRDRLWLRPVVLLLREEGAGW